jgi:GLPGLI family protein
MNTHTIHIRFPFPTILMLALTLGVVVGRAQVREGEVKYLITHDWVKKMSAIDYISKAQRDRLAYVWGGRSQWSEYALLYFSPDQSRYEESEETVGNTDDGFSHKRDEYIIFRDLAHGRKYDVMKVLGKLYVIDDTLLHPQWKILNDMREIAGHICMNASWEDTLKMQKVIAWFALDIPVSSGPERFGGLPGLILEVNINNGAMIISAESLIPQEMSSKITKPHYKRAKRITEDAYHKILKDYFAQRRKMEEPPFWGIRY